MRVQRLSASATNLLRELASEHARIVYSLRAGTYDLCRNGGQPAHLNPRTVSALAASGMVSKHDGSGGGIEYVISGRARRLLANLSAWSDTEGQEP